MFENDDDDFPLKCPNCLHEFYEKVGRIKAGIDTRCPDCGTVITHPAGEFQRLLENRNNEIRDYLRRFMRLTFR